MRNRKRVWVVLPALLMLFAVASVALAWDEPVYMSGHPTCLDVGYDHGFTVSPVETGIYWVPGLGDAGKIWIWRHGGLYFNWKTVFGVDVVIVRGGTGANVYYSDEEHWGKGFHAPINPETGWPSELGYVTFCWDAPPPCLPGVCP